LGECVSTYNSVLQRLDLSHHVDEVAYLFLDRNHLDIFTREAVRTDGCIMFNTAEDHVHTLPLKTCYDVEYRFFTVPVQFLPGIEQVRVEAMQIKRGFSPLHEAEAPSLASVGAPMGAIHASFKCQTEEEYAAVVVRLRERGWEVAQKCDSTYGRFSYWSPVDREEWLPDGPYLYLKPRVNTRDMNGGHDGVL
jgi:hypothetical protein